MVAKSIERIHRANLINFGIIPFEFEDPSDYDAISQGDPLQIEGVREAIAGDGVVTVKCGKRSFMALARLSEREKHLILCGGLLASLK